MVDGTLRNIAIEKLATVLTYKVPPSYGGYATEFPKKIVADEINGPIDLTSAENLNEKYGDKIRIYPGSMELRDGKIYALKSRAVGILGIGDSIEEARQISQEGAKAITGGALWNRTDVAAKEHIQRSIIHMDQLRRAV